MEYGMPHSPASFFLRNCGCFFRCIDRRLTIFSVWPSCCLTGCFCVLPKPVTDFQVLSFSYRFFSEVKSFSVANIDCCQPCYGDMGTIHKYPVVIRLKSSFFPPRSQSVFNPDYLLPSSPIKKLQIFLFPISVKSVFISFFMVSPNQQSVIALQN